MEPAYYLENRYSFAVDRLKTVRAATYELDTPETAFERDVQHQLALANRLLMTGRFTAALERYRHVRGLIAAVIDPRVTVGNGRLVDWASLDKVQLVDTVVLRAAELLKHMPVSESRLPASAHLGGPAPEAVGRQFRTAGEIGVSDREAAVGSSLAQAELMIEQGDFAGAANRLQRAVRESQDSELQAALLHDLAIVQERSGDRETALRTMQQSERQVGQTGNHTLQIAALTSLAAMQARGGSADAATVTLTQANRLRTRHNIFSILTRTTPGAAAAAGERATRPGLGGLLAGEQPTGSRPPGTTRPSAPELVEVQALLSQPVRLLAATTFAARTSEKQWTMLTGDNAPARVRLDANAAQNLGRYLERVRDTSDLGLLMGYLNGRAITVAYLPHVYFWVIPMAVGDCLAALGAHAEAEKEYLSTLEYKYLNRVVESVNLWVRLAELYLDWGDRLYRQARNDTTRFGAAREKYERVVTLDGVIDAASPLYAHERFAAMRTRVTAAIQAAFVHRTAIGENPRILMALRRARMQLRKIASGLNFIGLSLHLPPFSFEYLQTMARYFTQHASQVEQAYIQFQSTGENEQLREQQLAQHAEVASASVELERRGLEEALSGVRVAQANLDAATVQHQNAVQAANDFASVRWELLELEHLQAWAAASAVDRSDQVKLTIDWTYYQSDKKRRNEVLQDLARQRTRISHDLEAKRLQREIAAANAYRQVAQNQLQQARARVEVAEQRVAIAELQAQHAGENLAFLDAREFGSAMWYNLAREARRLAERYVDMAVEAATMMERAYEAETGRDLRKIKFEYGLNHLNGMLGAQALLLDIDFFTVDHLRTKAKKAQLKQTLSLADHFPLAFEKLLDTGHAWFETTLEHFDRRYPGFYLQKVKQVELVFVGLTGSEGVAGTLRNIGLSQFRRRNGDIVDQAYPADVMPLSEYNVRYDAIVFQLDGKELRLFENNGVATMWQLDLPRGTNTFDLRQVLDIHLVVYYDGFFDPALEQQVLAALPAGGSASRALGLRLYAPDELYFLRHQGTAELRITPDLFPANHTNLRLTRYFLTVAAEGGSAPGMRVRVDLSDLGAGHEFTLDAAGQASSDEFPGPVGRSIFDTWTLRIDPAVNPGIDLGALRDVALFIEYDFEYRP